MLNWISKKLLNKESKPSLTEEQSAIVHSNSDSLRVIAFAGAGKTSTLKAYAEARPESKIIYLAFNKSICAEAASKFPKNVTCITTHSLAYRSVGKNYRHKLQPNIRPHQAASILGFNPSNIVDLKQASLALKVLNHYLASPFLTTEEFRDNYRNLYDPISLEKLDGLWQGMIDPQKIEMPMLHDGYLKLYQTQRPKLNFDIILFDEAQDANPVTLELIKEQECRKIIVGDPHQQIYQFRKATNAMEDPMFQDTLYLTNSFRFGTVIANLANNLLKIKRESKVIHGKRIASSDDSYAFISRGNAAIFSKASELAKANENIYFVGGIEGYRFDLLMDIYNLKRGNFGLIKDTFLRNFKKYDSLCDYAESQNERDLLAWINLISHHSNWLDIPSELTEIRRLNSTEVPTAHKLTTAHKSKGLEFGTVEMAPDFLLPQFLDKPSSRVVYKEDELNICYVAITRAEKKLLVSKNLSEILRNTVSDFVQKNPDFIWDKQESKLPTSLKVDRLVEPQKTENATSGLIYIIKNQYGFYPIFKLKRFNSDGWFSVGQIPLACPHCENVNVEGYRKAYKTTKGIYYYWALLCTNCMHLFDPNSLDKVGLAILKKNSIPLNSSPVIKDVNQTDISSYRLATDADIKVGVWVIHFKFGKGQVKKTAGAGKDLIADIVFDKKVTKTLLVSHAKLRLNKLG